MPFSPAVKDQTFPRGTEINGKEAGLSFLFH